MNSLLTTLRQQTPQPTPAEFLAQHPGCWIQYYDDTDAKDPGKAVSAPFLNPWFAKTKQQDKCAICFSLQAFKGARRQECVAFFRNLGVDVDLVRKGEQGTIASAEIDRVKEEYLRTCLQPFPLKPHWLIETRHGFHVIFRVQPVWDEERIRAGEEINRRLVSVLRGDDKAHLLTQVLRVPGTEQFKDPAHPFLCHLLIDNAKAIPAYDLDAVRSILDAWETFSGTEEDARPASSTQNTNDAQGRRWRDGLAGVPEGQRNATAASIVGGILGRLPEELWETAGWGGLKEWNQLNPVPLPERELRSVYDSIARRERAKRRREGRGIGGEEPMRTQVHVDAQIASGRTVQPRTVENGDNAGTPSAAARSNNQVHGETTLQYPSVDRAGGHPQTGGEGKASDGTRRGGSPDALLTKSPAPPSPPASC
jgi:hypothetical protein